MKSPARFLYFFSILLFIVASLFLIYKYRAWEKQNNENGGVLEDECSMDLNAGMELIPEEFYTRILDFETNDGIENLKFLRTQPVHNGTRSYEIDTQTEFGFTYTKVLKSIPGYRCLNKIHFSSWFYADTSECSPSLVVEIETADGKNIFWKEKVIQLKSSIWQKGEGIFELPDSTIKPGNQLKMYIWNKHKQAFMIDDIEYGFIRNVAHKLEYSNRIPERTIIYDFEKPLDGSNAKNYVSNIKHSGNLAFKLSNNESYSPAITRKINDVIDGPFKLITASVWVYSEDKNSDILLVVAIKDKDGHEYFWNGKSIARENYPDKTWNKLRTQIKLPWETISASDEISVYVWDKSNSTAYIDDMEIVYGETNIRAGDISNVAVATMPDSSFSFSGSRGPFKTLNLQLINGKSDSPNLLAVEELKNMLSSKSLISGVFFPDEGKSQIAVVRNKQIDFYAFCNLSERFLKVFSFNLPLTMIGHNCEIHAVNYDSDLIDEIAIFDANASLLYIYKLPNIHNSCNEWKSANDELEAVWKLDKLSGNNLLSVNSSVATGKLIDDKKSLVIVNPDSGSLNIFGNGKEGFNLIKENISFSFIKRNEKFENVYVLDKINDFPGCIYLGTNATNERKLISWNSQISDFSEWGASLLPSRYFNSFTSMINWEGGEKSNGNFILLNRVMRFDLKLVHLDKTNFSVKNQLEFSGYPTGKNPKYYEFTRVLPGNFTKRNSTEIAIIMSNCSDLNFDGHNCKSLDFSSELFPPSLQLYTIPNP